MRHHRKIWHLFNSIHSLLWSLQCMYFNYHQLAHATDCTAATFFPFFLMSQTRNLTNLLMPIWILAKSCPANLYSQSLTWTEVILWFWGHLAVVQSTGLLWLHDYLLWGKFKFLLILCMYSRTFQGVRATKAALARVFDEGDCLAVQRSPIITVAKCQLNTWGPIKKSL